MFNHLKDATLEAQADISDVLSKVIEEVITPQIILAARMKWARMTPEEKELFKRQRPEEYKAFMEGVKDAK